VFVRDIEASLPLVLDNVRDGRPEKIEYIFLGTEPPRRKRVDENITAILEHNGEERLLRNTRHESQARVDWLCAVGQHTSNSPKILRATD
jgi:hypothetical protein